jgi:spore coat protein CotH
MPKDNFFQVVGALCLLSLAGCNSEAPSTIETAPAEAPAPGTRQPVVVATSMMTVPATPGSSDDTTGTSAEDLEGPDSAVGEATPSPIATDQGARSDAAAGGHCPPTCGPTTDQFYDTDKLATIRVEIGEEALDGYFADEWEQRLFDIRDQCDPVYIPSTFTYESPDGVEDVTLENVGIRARGSMSFTVNKVKGFKLNFHDPAYEAANPGSERRRFADINRLNTLSLKPARSANLDWDSTHLFQCLTYKMMRDFDVVAPQCNHLQVIVNGSYYALMENVEETDHGRFLAHRFGATDGIMVKASPSQRDCGYRDGVADLTYKGDNYSDYADPLHFDIERGTEADLEDKLFPMFKCADASSTPSDDDFRTCISEWLDVGEWLRLIAAESIIPELETLHYGRNIHLYFVRDATLPNGGRWLISVWDVDAALNGQECSSGGGGGGGFGGVPTGGGGAGCDPFTAVSSLFSGTRLALVSRLTSVFSTEYCQALSAFLDDVYSTQKIDEMASVMEPAMVNEPNDSQQQWQAAIGTTRSFIESNGAAMRTAVASACD